MSSRAQQNDSVFESFCGAKDPSLLQSAAIVARAFLLRLWNNSKNSSQSRLSLERYRDPSPFAVQDDMAQQIRSQARAIQLSVPLLSPF